MTELTEEQNSIIEKVQKLLNLANKNPNEAEAAAATAKAQALLTAYNLDLAMVSEVSTGDAKREKDRLKGGAYIYQRELWRSVARLNFCLYWTSRRFVHFQRRRKQWDGSIASVDVPKLQWHHMLVGRVVNVKATRIMAEYLEGAIERLVRDRLRNKATGEVPHTELFSNWAVSYRTGAAYKVIEKIEERRDQMRAEENRKRNEAARNGVSTATALTIASYTDSELDANLDHVHGEGWSAKRAAERAAQAQAAREAEEEYTRWAAAHPEEARKEEAKQRLKEERAEEAAMRRALRAGDKLNSSAYYSGFDAADSISIDQQVDTTKQKRIA